MCIFCYRTLVKRDSIDNRYLPAQFYVSIKSLGAALQEPEFFAKLFALPLQKLASSALEEIDEEIDEDAEES